MIEGGIELNMEIKRGELPIEVCKDKEAFVEAYLKPLLTTSDSAIADVLYEYYFNGDSAIDEIVEVRYIGGSSLTINVSRDSKAQLVIDVAQVLDKERKISPSTTLGTLIEKLKQGDKNNDVRIFFPKSRREDIEFGIDKIEHNIGGYGVTQIILKNE